MMDEQTTEEGFERVGSLLGALRDARGEHRKEVARALSAAVARVHEDHRRAFHPALLSAPMGASVVQTDCAHYEHLVLALDELQCQSVTSPAFIASVLEAEGCVHEWLAHLRDRLLPRHRHLTASPDAARWDDATSTLTSWI